MADSYGVIDHRESLYIANAIVTGLSIIGEIFALWAFLWKRKVQQDYRFKLIMGLITCNFITSVSNILSLFNDNSISIDGLCEIDGFLRYFGEISSMVLIIAISDVSCKKIQDPRLDPEDHYKKAFIIAISSGLVIASIPLVGSISNWYPGYQRVELWCSDTNNVILVIFLTAITACLAILLIEYARMMDAIRNYSIISEEDMQSNSSRIILYPAIFILSWIPGIINTCFVIFQLPPNYLLTMGQIIGIHSLGFTNGVYYGMSRYASIKNELHRQSVSEINDFMTASFTDPKNFDDLGASIIEWRD